MSDDDTGLLSRITDDEPRRGGQFPVALRGYDRAAVDAYVEAIDGELGRLQELVTGLDSRVRVQEQEHRAQLERLRREAAAAQAPSYAGLGERVAQILALAEEEARALREGAQAEADRLRGGLDAEVRLEVDQAKRMAQEQIDLLRADAERDRTAAAELSRAAAAEQAEAAQTARATREQADAVLGEAHQRAVIVVSEAEREAALRTGDAEAQADAAIQDAERKAASLVAEAEIRAADLIDEAKGRAVEEEDAARARLDALAREHRGLLDRLETIRDALASLTGSPVPPSRAETAAAAAVEETGPGTR